MAHEYSWIYNPPRTHLDYDDPRNQREDYKTLPLEIGKEFQAALEGMREDMKEALTYKVSHSKVVTLRAEPSVYSKEVGRLQPGEVVKGFPVGSWLLLTSCSAALPKEGAWVLVDGTALGVPDMLMPEWSQMALTSVKEGVHVQFPGIKKSDAYYYLQWEPQYGTPGTDGGTVIAKQPADAQDDVVALLVGEDICEGKKVKVRPIARLKSGLLVGGWKELFIDELVDASSLKPATTMQQDDLAAETDRYKQLVVQLAAYQKKANFEYNEYDKILAIYSTRPREGEEAKEKFLNALFGESKSTKAAAKAEGNVQGMFEGATGVYEEGISGQCNALLASVISTLARKHG